MPSLPIDEGVVTACRALAHHIAASVHRFIHEHTTVSIERTVLRAYGVDGVNPDGVPLVNTCVDRYREKGLLGQGIARFLGWALARGARTPQEAAEELAYGDGPGLNGLADVPHDLGHRIDQALLPHTREALARLDQARDQRRAARDRLGFGPERARPVALELPKGPPYKYVIVATGNIYDDADQARAAAQAGADVIAVIRSTAQSLIDYVP